MEWRSTVHAAAGPDKRRVLRGTEVTLGPATCIGFRMSSPRVWRLPLRPLRPTRLPRPSPHVGGHSCDHLVKSFWNGLLRESEVTHPSARRQARRCAVLRSAGGYSRSTPGGDRSTMPSLGNWRSPVRLRQSTGIWNFSARTEVTRAPESAHKSLRAVSP